MGALTAAGRALDQYRERHHAVARLVAIGATHDHIRRQTGISFKRISILLADPSFKELVTLYRDDVEKIWNRNVDQYLDLGMANMIQTEAMIADQLEEADEAGDKLPLLTLNRLSQDRADRFGYPKTSQVEHKHDFAALLDRAIERSGKAREVKVIESTAVEVSEGSQSSRTKPPLLPSGPEAAKTGERSKPPARPSFAAILTTKRRRVA
jgi:hypothetical protein